MNCPPEIARILLQILHDGIIRTRVRGWKNDAKGAALEANHVHNLPSLLLNFSEDKLEYYWEAERPSYIESHQRLGNSFTGFEELWKQLQLAVPTLKSDAAIARDDAGELD